MRALLVLLLIAGLAVGLVLLLGDDPRSGGGSRTGGAADEAPGATGGELVAGRDVPDEADPSIGERRSQGEAPTPEPEPEDPEPARPDHTRDRRLEAIWTECVEEPDPEAMRACLRGHLAGMRLGPEELAELACGEVPPDGFDQIFIEEVAWSWSAADAPRQILAFHAICNAPGNLWAGFLERQAERDPGWLETFAAALAEQDLLEGSGLVFLLCANTLAEMGHANMAEYLDLCARGQLGGGDAQVAFAITNALAARADAEQGLAFLLSVARSPGFEGRPGEVKALARGLLETTLPGFDAASTLAAVNELLDDPVVGPGIAAHLLDLQLWNRLPAWLTREQAEALVERARAAS